MKNKKDFYFTYANYDAWELLEQCGGIQSQYIFGQYTGTAARYRNA